MYENPDRIFNNLIVPDTGSPEESNEEDDEEDGEGNGGGELNGVIGFDGDRTLGDDYGAFLLRTGRPLRRVNTFRIDGNAP